MAAIASQMAKYPIKYVVFESGMNRVARKLNKFPTSPNNVITKKFKKFLSLERNLYVKK